MPITNPHSIDIKSNNKGSCFDLANYLDKEIENKFFNHTEIDIKTYDVVQKIDTNISKLGKNDDKFFAPTINFSDKELKHILKDITNKKIDNISQLTPKEKEIFESRIIDYSRLVMNNYAQNFNRGLKGKDLVYFGKIEHNRTYKFDDRLVKKGYATAGTTKPGLNTHVHIIVSRKDITQRYKLSPTTTYKQGIKKVGKNVGKIGFDRKNFKNLNEKSFDNLFAYNRGILEKFNVLNTLKKGSPQQRFELKEKILHKVSTISNDITKRFKHIEKDTRYIGNRTVSEAKYKFLKQTKSVSNTVKMTKKEIDFQQAVNQIEIHEMIFEKLDNEISKVEDLRKQEDLDYQERKEQEMLESEESSNKLKQEIDIY